MSDIVINRACPVGCAGTPEAQQRLRELETQCAEFQKSYLGAMTRTGELLAELEQAKAENARLEHERNIALTELGNLATTLGRERELARQENKRLRGLLTSIHNILGTEGWEGEWRKLIDAALGGSDD